MYRECQKETAFWQTTRAGAYIHFFMIVLADKAKLIRAAYNTASAQLTLHMRSASKARYYFTARFLGRSCSTSTIA